MIMNPLNEPLTEERVPYRTYIEGKEIIITAVDAYEAAEQRARLTNGGMWTFVEALPEGDMIVEDIINKTRVLVTVL